MMPRTASAFTLDVGRGGRIFPAFQLEPANMYATIRRYTIARGAARELAERVESEVVPMMRAIPGFVSYSLVEGDRRDGRDTLAAISVYETRLGAEESVKQASAWVRETCTAWQPVMTDVTAGEIVVSAGSSAPAGAR